MSFIFYKTRQFLLFRGRQARTPTVSGRRRTVPALTLEPRCNIIVHSCLLVFLSRAVVYYVRLHFPFLFAVNSLPPDIFLKMLLPDEALTLIFSTIPLQAHTFFAVKFVLWHIFWASNQLFPPFPHVGNRISSKLQSLNTCILRMPSSLHHTDAIHEVK